MLPDWLLQPPPAGKQLPPALAAPQGIFPQAQQPVPPLGAMPDALNPMPMLTKPVVVPGGAAPVVRRAPCCVRPRDGTALF